MGVIAMPSEELAAEIGPRCAGRSLANLAAGTIIRMATLAHTRLKRMHYVPGLVDGFLSGTGCARHRETLTLQGQ